MTGQRQMRMLLILGFLTAAVGGCASSQVKAPEPSGQVMPMDLPGLAGTWQGTVSGSQGLSQPMTLRIAPGGTYSADAGVYTAQGTAEVRDGKLVLTSASTTGGQAAQRTSTAVLSERRLPSQVIQTLTGSGASSTGPFSFEVSRPKQ